MKKDLPALATLALAACAHSNYRTTYLEEYAAQDCYELRTARLTVESELDLKWWLGYSSRNSANSAQTFAVTNIQSRHTIYEVYPPSIDVNPAQVRRQKDRMRNHAKWQALVQLEQTRGCRHEANGPASFGVVLGEVEE